MQKHDAFKLTFSLDNYRNLAFLNWMSDCYCSYQLSHESFVTDASQLCWQ